MKILVTLLIILLLSLQYKLWFDHGGVREVLRLRHEVAQQEKDNAKLRDRNKALQAEVDDLKQGHAAVEERARTELGMVKKNETFYQVVK